MTKDELKALGLTDEQVEKVVEDYGKNYVAKDQFNAKNDKLKSVEGELSKVRGEIDALQKANEGNEDLKKQIETMKAESEKRTSEYEAKISQMEIDNIVSAALVGAKAKNAKAVRALLDLSDAKVKDGKIKGLDEQLAEVVKDNPYLFGTTDAPKGTLPGNPGGSKGSNESVTKEAFAKMNYAQRAELFDSNPELYNSLTGGTANE